MKRFLKDFCLKGLIAMGFGPMVVAVIYGVLGVNGVVTSFSTREVVLAIVSSSLLAFIIAGMNTIYQIERLPLAYAILIHGLVLYAVYIIVYLVNGWLKSQLLPVAIFTVVFVVGYPIIWGCIYWITKRQTRDLNKKLNA